VTLTDQRPAVLEALLWAAARAGLQAACLVQSGDDYRLELVVASPPTSAPGTVDDVRSSRRLPSPWSRRSRRAANPVRGAPYMREPIGGWPRGACWVGPPGRRVRLPLTWKRSPNGSRRPGMTLAWYGWPTRKMAKSCGGLPGPPACRPLCLTGWKQQPMPCCKKCLSWTRSLLPSRSMPGVPACSHRRRVDRRLSGALMATSWRPAGGSFVLKINPRRARPSRGG